MINGDLYPDLVGINSDESTVQIYYNNNGTMPSTSSTILYGGPSGCGSDILVCDIDNDSDTDIIWTGKIYRNDNGSFVGPVQTLNYGTCLESIDAGDIDGNGFVDLFYSGTSGDKKSKIFLNNNGVFNTTPIWESPPLNNMEGKLIDVDGDGDLDVSTAVRQGTPSQIFFNIDGVISSTAGWSSYWVSEGNVAWADIDNDGDLDLAMSRYDEGWPDYLQIYYNHLEWRFNVSMTMDQPEYSGLVSIPYTIENPGGNPTSLICRYSIDDGTSWLVPTTTSDTTDLTTGQYTGTIAWNTITDGLDHQDIPNVLFAITPYDQSNTGRSDTISFHLDNNALPTVEATPVAGEQSGDVQINFSYSDAEGDTLALFGEFQAFGDTEWRPATLSGDTSNLFALSGTVTWHTLSDLPDQSEPYLLRLITQDLDPGIPDTILIRLDNYHQQSISISINEDPVRDTLAIHYNITDITNDTLILVCRYSTDGNFNANRDFLLTSGSGDPEGSRKVGSGRVRAVDPERSGMKESWGMGTRTSSGNAVKRGKQKPDLLNSPPVRPQSSSRRDLRNKKHGKVGGSNIIFKYLPGVGVNSENEISRPFYTPYTDLSNWFIPYIPDDTLEITPDKYSGTLQWYTHFNMPGMDIDSVFIAITPNDTWENGVGDTLVFRLDNNRSPRIEIATLEGEQKNDIPVSFTLSDAENDIIGIECQYKQLYEQFWHEPDTSGSRVAYQPGNYQLIWHSLTDLPEYTGEALFRIRPFDTDPGVWDTVSILVDQVGAPMVSLSLDTQVELSGDIPVEFTVSDDEADTVRLYIYYSLNDGASWDTASVSGTITGLDSANYMGSFIWNSDTDAPGVDVLNARLRAVSYDGHWGGEHITPPFHLDNNQPPQVTLSLVYDEYSGLISIPFQLTDAENDSIDIQALYAVNPAFWDTATIEGSNRFAGNYAGELPWISDIDLAGQDIDSVWIKFLCADLDPGIADSTVLHVDNNLPPSVVLNLSGGEYHGDISSEFSFLDPEGDPVNYGFSFSPDSVSWEPATVTIAGSAGNTVDFTWHSLTDMEMADVQLYFKVFVSDIDPGGSGVTRIRVDNYQGLLLLEAPTGEQTGAVEIGYNITDPGNDDMTVDWQYRLPEASQWQSMNGITDTIFSPTTYSGSVIWQSETDLNNRDVDSVQVRGLIADEWDFGIGDTVIIDIDNQFAPGVIDQYPLPQSLVYWSTPIQVTFSQEMNPASLSGNITIQTVAGNTLPIRFELDSSSLSITPDTAFPTDDTVSVLLSAGITNFEGVSLDGNQNGDPDGSPDDDVRWRFYTTYPGDYDLDRDIDFDDLIIFKDTWMGRDTIEISRFELAPFTGTVPRVTVTPDGELDIRDLATFIYMWNWSFNNTGYQLAMRQPKTTAVVEDGMFRFRSNFETTDDVWNRNYDDQLILSVGTDRNIAIDALEIVLWYYPDELEFDHIAFTGAADTLNSGKIRLAVNDEKQGLIIINIVNLSDSSLFVNDNDVAKVFFNPLISRETTLRYSNRGRSLTKGELSESGTLELTTQPPVPKRFALHDNYPNPFNPITKIRYEIPKGSNVQLLIYNILGRNIKTLVKADQNPGYYEIIWDGTDSSGKQVSSGVYFYVLQTEKYIAAKKLVLLK
ncbi:MAG: T9SS type A sorting domain-containing protein [FCB group bacterium]|nr:T9SS type A sorting domain-containing protein [FCB group bacterium]